MNVTDSERRGIVSLLIRDLEATAGPGQEAVVNDAATTVVPLGGLSDALPISQP
jgi:hypothetical protein